MKKVIINRNTLQNEFSRVLEYPLTVATAPMGYGKTFATHIFLNKNKINYLWFSIEVDQVSYHSIWDTFCRQLSNINKSLANKLSIMGFPRGLESRNYIFQLLKEFAIEESVIVIDDYHFANSSELDAFINLLVIADIKRLHILILSRSLPDINILEFSLKYKCYVIKHDSFVLDKNEIVQYFNLLNLSITPRVIDRVYEISEGWITAVSLLANKYKVSLKIDDTSGIENLIEESIVSRYSHHKIDILSILSIVDGFTLDFADFLLEYNLDDIKECIDNNSFILYDEKNEEYKMHSIFRCYFLKHYFNKKEDKELYYQKVGKWYSDNLQYIKAIQNFIKSKDYMLVLDELSKENSPHIVLRNSAYIFDIMNNVIPKEILYNHPKAVLTYVSFVISVIDKNLGLKLLKDLEEYYINNDSIPNDLISRMRGEIETLRAFGKYNSIEKMGEYFRKAQDLLQGKTIYSSQNRSSSFGGISYIFTYFTESGELLHTLKRIKEYGNYATNIFYGQDIGLYDLTRGEYYLEVLDINRAKIYLHNAIKKGRNTKQNDIILLSHFNLARIMVYEGEHLKAIDLLLNLEEKDYTEYNVMFNSQYEICLAYILCLTDGYDNIANWIKEGDYSTSKILPWTSIVNYLIHAKTLLFNKEYLRLELACEELYEKVSEYNYILGYVHCYILEGIAKYKLYGIDRSFESITKAINIAEKDDICMLLIEYGNNLAEIIKKSNIKSDYIAKLINEINSRKVNLNKKQLLTIRENEILSLVIQGKSNKEIANILFIAEITVKKALSNIYKKLGFKNRIEIISQYKINNL